MRKRTIYFSVPEKITNSLHYMVIGYSAIYPVEFLRPILLKYKFGILLIGNDGPDLLKPEQSQRLVDGLQSEGIPASVTGGFLWVSPDGVPEMCKMESFTCEGDALLLKTQPVDETFECPHMPYLSGFNKDKLRAKYVTFLSSILSFNDVYVRTDFAFSETLVVTKNSEILHALKDEVEGICQKLNEGKS